MRVLQLNCFPAAALLAATAFVPAASADEPVATATCEAATVAATPGASVLPQASMLPAGRALAAETVMSAATLLDAAKPAPSHEIVHPPADAAVSTTVTVSSQAASQPTTTASATPSAPAVTTTTFPAAATTTTPAVAAAPAPAVATTVVPAPATPVPPVPTATSLAAAAHAAALAALPVPPKPPTATAKAGARKAPAIEKLVGLAPGLSAKAIREALAAVDCAKAKGIAPEAERLAIVDYTRSSVEPRLWVFDLEQHKVLFEEYVAHGRGSGLDVPNAFSNRSGSYQTSLGLFVTDETYEGGNGYSLNLRGLSVGLNDLAYARRIVMHGADYVNPEKAKVAGRLGRSLGCPAVRPQVARPIIDTLKDGQFFYAYGPGSSAATTCDTVQVASTGTGTSTN